ncbi:MAG: tRNA (adenosine(37)-N6)-threonylcarbamoyltransferase complex transferase subunit TsaD [Akkermansiaceae bacterium]|nr:tRNA (adenosine(37)-N6)-threonylcarbamoyltransferase complex transferase subunit TsaD [Akkermansiaceae bacterium]
MPTILALETSCDESAVAILRDGDLLASLVASQAGLHRAYGGVVPELASRNHVVTLRPLVEQALGEAGLGTDEIDALAATRGPGLASSLLVGHTMAKGLAIATGKPFLSVNHMEGHLLSPFLEAGRAAPDGLPDAGLPPHLGLVVSGGHTLLVRVRGLGRYEILGRTIDDAAGEAFDKTARLLGLPYPGGPEIEKAARHGDPTAYPFPRSMPGEPDFSFSGLKTAVRYTLEKIASPEPEIPNLCASFQQAVIDVLTDKALRAAASCGASLLTLSGGVSCNEALRHALHTACDAAGIRFLACAPSLSTDNAAMIAFAAALHLEDGVSSSIADDIDPNLSLAGGR